VRRAGGPLSADEIPITLWAQISSIHEPPSTSPPRVSCMKLLPVLGDEPDADKINYERLSDELCVDVVLIGKTSRNISKFNFAKLSQKCAKAFHAMVFCRWISKIPELCVYQFF
jgi:hypothetical protein